MSHTLAGKITRAPMVKPGQNNSGPYTGFFFELSEHHKGHNGGEDEYTNYSIALFPKSQAAIDFHTKAIAKGSFVVINCDKLKIDLSNPEYPKIKMDNARLDGFMNPNEGAPQQQQAQQQQYQPAPQQQMQQQQMAPPQPQYQPAPQPQMQQQQMNNGNGPAMDMGQPPF